MYLSNKDLSKAIQNDLKAAGVPRAAYSIRVKNAGYSTAINIEVKDLSIRLEKVENIANKRESIRYDEYCQEILEGGNTFVNVRYDYDALNAARAPFMEKAKELTSNPPAKCSGVTIMESKGKRLIFMYSGPGHVQNSLIVFDDKGRSMEYGRYSAYNEYVISEGMAIFSATGRLN